MYDGLLSITVLFPFSCVYQWKFGKPLFPKKKSQNLLKSIGKYVHYCIQQARENFRNTVSGAFVGPVEGEFAIGISLYNSYDQLYTSGIRASYLSIKRLQTDGKSSSRLNAEVVRNVELNQLITKMEKLVDSMHRFFIRTNSSDPNLSIVAFTDTSVNVSLSIIIIYVLASTFLM